MILNYKITVRLVHKTCITVQSWTAVGIWGFWKQFHFVKNIKNILKKKHTNKKDYLTRQGQFIQKYKAF